jgi:hypothetical protein
MTNIYYLLWVNEFTSVDFYLLSLHHGIILIEIFLIKHVLLMLSELCLHHSVDISDLLLNVMLVVVHVTILAIVVHLVKHLLMVYVLNSLVVFRFLFVEGHEDTSGLLVYNRMVGHMKSWVRYCRNVREFAL